MASFASMIAHVIRRELNSLQQELELYADERQIWALPPGWPNSAGTLSLHLVGNLRYYVGAVLGGSHYVRDRAREFSARDVRRSELLDQVRKADAEVHSALARLGEEELSKPFPEAIRDRRIETGDMLLQLAVHLGYHLGQVSYHRRLVTGNAEGVGALDPAGLLTAQLPPTSS